MDPRKVKIVLRERRVVIEKYDFGVFKRSKSLYKK